MLRAAGSRESGRAYCDHGDMAGGWWSGDVIIIIIIINIIIIMWLIMVSYPVAFKS